jgi:DNA adenine methylase
LDPPYAIDNQRIFRQYGPTTFGSEDLLELADYLFCLDAIGAAFLLSYADSAEARTLFAHWTTFSVNTVRNIAGFAERRRISAELIVTNAQAASKTMTLAS